PGDVGVLRRRVGARRRPAGRIEDVEAVEAPAPAFRREELVTVRRWLFILMLPAATAAAQPRAVDLVVRHGTVVTVDPAHRVIADGAVAIEGGRIVAVGPAAEVDAAVRGRETLDAKGGLV